MNNIFELRNADTVTREKYKLNLEIPKPNQATFGTRSLRSYGRKIWNAFPYHIKTSENLNSFRAIIKCQDGNHCTCRVCKHFEIVCLRFGRLLLVGSFSSDFLRAIANYWKGVINVGCKQTASACRGKWVGGMTGWGDLVCVQCFQMIELMVVVLMYQCGKFMHGEHSFSFNGG